MRELSIRYFLRLMDQTCLVSLGRLKVEYLHDIVCEDFFLYERMVDVLEGLL